MEFVFYNEITGEQKIIFADDQECAEAELHKNNIQYPEHWRISRPWGEVDFPED